MRQNTCTRGVTEYRIARGKEFYITILYWVDDLTKSVWNVCIKVWYMKRTLETVCSRIIMLFWMGNSVEGKPFINRKSKSLELTI